MPGAATRTSPAWRSAGSRVDWALLAAPALLLLLLNIAYFASRGLLGTFMQANFTANAVYAATTPVSFSRTFNRFTTQFYQNPLAWAGALMAPLYLLLVKNTDAAERRSFALVGLWFICPLIGIVAARRMDGHQFLQLLPALSLLTGLVAAGVLAPLRAQADRVRLALAILLIVAAPLYPAAYPKLLQTAQDLFTHYVKGQPWPQDANFGVARYLQERIQPGESLFVVDYNPVIYTMVDAPIPTRYTLLVYMVTQWYEPVVGVDQAAAMDEAMARRPTYVLRQARPNREFDNPRVAERLDVRLAADYTLAATLPGVETYTFLPVDVLVYRLKTP